LRSQVINLLRSELKHEVRRKALCIALDGFVQSTGAHAVSTSQIAIKNHTLAPQYQDVVSNPLNTRYGFHPGTR
jgi:hypothetical protein